MVTIALAQIMKKLLLFSLPILFGFLLGAVAAFWFLSYGGEVKRDILYFGEYDPVTGRSIGECKPLYIAAVSQSNGVYAFELDQEYGVLDGVQVDRCEFNMNDRTSVFVFYSLAHKILSLSCSNAFSHASGEELRIHAVYNPPLQTAGGQQFNLMLHGSLSVPPSTWSGFRRWFHSLASSIQEETVH